MNQKGEKFDLRDGKMNSPQTIINKGDNAHGHYTLFTSVNSIPT